MRERETGRHHYLVGGGIASLAAAVFLIRDAGVSGEDITIYDKEERLGGSLDGAGDGDIGYLVRGGRMFEQNFVCTFNLLETIPDLEDHTRSVRDDIFEFNNAVRGSSKCRLLRQGAKADVSFGLGFGDLYNLAKLTLASEGSLGAKTIEDCFSPAFFRSNFWIMWSTTFAFQRWHSATELARYFRRFVHLFPGFKKLEGVLRTRFNQYDSLIAPITAWLAGHGVHFERGTHVVEADIKQRGENLWVAGLEVTRSGQSEHIAIGESDCVYLTLGSMTDGSTIGSNSAPPSDPAGGDAWAFWRKLAARNPVFGRPETFCGQSDRSRWTSFTATLKDTVFFDFMEKLTGNKTGTGGLVTFADSKWMLSIVMFHQPHFRTQTDHWPVFWGYGLQGEQEGDFVKKPMALCTGDEIMEELAGHLKLEKGAEAYFLDAIVRPCTMPFITSQFMPRRSGDRPPVVPDGAQNFAVIGQYCEMPDDVVFTVEYSVRSAMTAVQLLMGGPPPPPVRRPDHNPLVLLNAARTALS